MKSIVPSDGNAERLETTNAELLRALREMILSTRRRMQVMSISTETEAILYMAEGVVARAEGLVSCE